MTAGPHSIAARYQLVRAARAYRLTPDIIVRGRPPTRAIYEASLRLLLEVATSSSGVVSTWRCTTWTEDEHEAGIAHARQGLTRKVRWCEGFADELTEYGQIYLGQRINAPDAGAR
jgi:hypothetical protein